MKRYPDGVTGKHFYEKDAPSFTPEWVQTFAVPRRSGVSAQRCQAERYASPRLERHTGHLPTLASS
jgi:DNA primase